jgi:hypothetical protein
VIGELEKLRIELQVLHEFMAGNPPPPPPTLTPNTYSRSIYKKIYSYISVPFLSVQSIIRSNVSVPIISVYLYPIPFYAFRFS